MSKHIPSDIPVSASRKRKPTFFGFRKRRAYLLALVSFSALALVGCGKGEVKTRETAPRVVRAFHVDHASQRPAPASRYTGVVRARTESRLGFRVAGKIAERLVNAGEAVRRGQALLKLDATDYDLALQAARALEEQAALELERVRVLVSKRAESREALERALAAAETSAAQAEQLANQASYTTLLADSDGIVMSTLAEPGQVVAAGQPVLVLARDGAREAEVDIPESALELLRGGRATAQLYLNADLVVPATLRELSGVADPVARTYQARYVLEGEASHFPLGATVTVRLSSEGEGGRPLPEVPLGSLIDRGEGAAVWVIDPTSSRISKRPVVIARLGAETATIRQGLQGGDLVVALGAQLLNAGDLVQVANASAKEVK